MKSAIEVAATSTKLAFAGDSRILRSTLWFTSFAIGTDHFVDDVMETARSWHNVRLSQLKVAEALI